MLSTHLKSLPKDLTSYDFLKTLAVILMIIDHVGYHFFPDEMWFRVLGRFCVPMWFFLVGYATTTKIPMSLWVGAIAVAASALVAGQTLFPLNILVTIMIARKLRDSMIMKTTYSPETMRGMFLILVLAAIPTSIVFEYGAVVFLFVVLGFISRHPEVISKRFETWHITLFTVLSYVTFFIWQGIMFPHLTYGQVWVLFIGAIMVGIMLEKFKPETYPVLTKKLPFPLCAVIRLIGRRTLEIYVIQFLIIRGAAMVYNPEKFPLWDWTFFQPGALLVFT